MSAQEVLKVKEYSDRVRKAGNELVGIMLKKYEQLLRTKRYRKLLALYGSTEDKKKRKKYGKQLNKMQEEHDVTFEFCRTAMQRIRLKYDIDAVFGLTKAEDVWRGIEKCLYSNGETIHFSSYGDFPCIRAKQSNRGIPITAENGELISLFFHYFCCAVLKLSPFLPLFLTPLRIRHKSLATDDFLIFDVISFIFLNVFQKLLFFHNATPPAVCIIVCWFLR